jgi:hypothetical protein
MHLCFIQPRAGRYRTLRGQVGGGWALEMESFLGPVKWHRSDWRVPFGAQKTRHILYKCISIRNRVCMYVCMKKYKNKLRVATGHQTFIIQNIHNFPVLNTNSF